VKTRSYYTREKAIRRPRLLKEKMEGARAKRGVQIGKVTDSLAVRSLIKRIASAEHTLQERKRKTPIRGSDDADKQRGAKKSREFHQSNSQRDESWCQKRKKKEPRLDLRKKQTSTSKKGYRADSAASTQNSKKKARRRPAVKKKEVH